MKKVKGKLWCCGLFAEKLAKDDIYIKGYLIGEQLLKHDFNIINIMNKLIEYESLKSVLFNKAQIDGVKTIQYPRLIDTSKELDEKVEEIGKGLRKIQYEAEEIEKLSKSVSELKNESDTKNVLIMEKIKLGME